MNTNDDFEKKMNAWIEGQGPDNRIEYQIMSDINEVLSGKRKNKRKIKLIMWIYCGMVMADLLLIFLPVNCRKLDSSNHVIYLFFSPFGEQAFSQYYLVVAISALLSLVFFGIYLKRPQPAI